jgi:hypothetical protein
MKTLRALFLGIGVFSLGTLVDVRDVRADVVTEMNAKAAELLAPIPQTLLTVRAMAVVQVSVHEAVNSITGRHPLVLAKLERVPDASVDAAVVSAMRTALVNLFPDRREEFETACRTLLARIPESPAKAAGIALGERAANAILESRAGDDAKATEPYRPVAVAGVYVPTTMPVSPDWGKRRPWLMTAGNQFRPGPPPALTSETWARDYNEVKALGAEKSTKRTPDQTASATFWEATSPVVYWPLARCVAERDGRDVSDNARLLAVAGMAMDDALIAVFDAKYTYNLWRPVTAIRNGDLDGNDATERVADWFPFIDTPMHPEYPCAHCSVSGALSAVLQADLGTEPCPELVSSSPTAPGADRRWSGLDKFCAEVAEARICDGVHFRHSTEVGTALGKRVGELAAKSMPQAKR